jgi:PPE-repeat protein
VAPAAQGTGWAAAPAGNTLATMPGGMGGAGGGGRGGFAFGAPRYGFKPIVMPRSVVV